MLLEILPAKPGSELPADCEARILAEIQPLLQADEQVILVFNVNTNKIREPGVWDAFLLNFCCVGLMFGIIIGVFLYGFTQDFLVTIAFALPAYLIIVVITTILMYFGVKRTYKKMIAVYSIQGLQTYLTYAVITNQQIIFKNAAFFCS